MSIHPYILEAIIIYGLIMGWAVWELRKTNKLIAKTKAEEAAAKAKAPERPDTAGDLAEARD